MLKRFAASRFFFPLALAIFIVALVAGVTLTGAAGGDWVAGFVSGWLLSGIISIGASLVLDPPYNWEFRELSFWIVCFGAVLAGPMIGIIELQDHWAGRT